MLVRAVYLPRMRRVEHALHVPAVAGEGDGQDCSTYVEKWVEVSGTFTGSLKVQGRLSAVFADVATANGGVTTLVECAPPFTEIRVDTTGVLSGTPAAVLVGRDRRTA